MAEREVWGTRIGFILAAVGSAVGLGNIWQFPFKTATFGGAAFLVVYLLAAVAIGLPAMLAEFVIGRRSNLNVVSAFRGLGYRKWRFVGVLGLLTGFWILSYYSVVGGWVIRYLLGSVTGAYFGDPAGYFGTISSGMVTVGFHAAFMAITVGIVAFGIEDGIEKATKVMVPSIVVLLLGLAAWAATLPGGAEGYQFFLSPDLSDIAENWRDIVPFAVGQAFFSLSLGMGAMITYSSYLGADDNLGQDSLSIVVFNTFVGVLAGLVVFPLLFAQGVEPGEGGAGAVFISVAQAFSELPAGRFLGVVFFGVVLIAALSSAISLLEVVTSYVVDNYDVSRPVTATGLGLVLFLLGVPSALDIAVFTWFDAVAYGALLPLSVLLVLVFVGWVLADEALDELQKGTAGIPTLGPVWLWTVRVVVLVAVLGTLVLGVQGLADDPGILPPI
ncbi:sodium-dependent transporter [Halostella sp. JP-L12]|uniref:sodium-dependent transporter n=1 Tax=Halostella TaxID=1843185 RepID=UPI000EF7D8F0|nr:MULTISPECIES: sodium-dependent transporter [Halostella]NHN48481.1 sodium-dependent transporter [Halostella sp. JP-L12]